MIYSDPIKNTLHSEVYRFLLKTVASDKSPLTLDNVRLV